MVGINNELDLCFNKCSVDIIAGYYYDSCDDVSNQLKKFREIVNNIKALKDILNVCCLDFLTNIGEKIKISSLIYEFIDQYVYSEKHSTFQNNNCFLTTLEHQSLVQSYQTANVNVPLFIQQSGFFRGGVFPKMGIGPEAEMVYRMVTTGDLNVLTHFRKIRGDNAEPIIDYMCLPPIHWDNSDYVRLLDTYASGEIEFLKYVANFRRYNFEEKIRISITDIVDVRLGFWRCCGEDDGEIVYSDNDVNPIGVYDYCNNESRYGYDWRDYGESQIGIYENTDYDNYTYDDSPPYYEEDY